MYVNDAAKLTIYKWQVFCY